MQDVECKINLIMFNPHEGTRFTSSTTEQVEAFRDIVMQVQTSALHASHYADEGLAVTSHETQEITIAQTCQSALQL